MYSTSSAPCGAGSWGTRSHAFTGSPAYPAKVTSKTSAERIGVATGTSSASASWAAAAASSPAQNSSKSAGSGTSGRYSRSWASGRSKSITRSRPRAASFCSVTATRSRALREGSGALGEVGARGALLLHRDLELERGRKCRPRRGVEDPLGKADRHRRAGEQLVDQGVDDGVELVGGGDPVGEADPLRLLAADHLPGHHQLLGAPEADDLGEAGGAADVGDQADPRLRHDDRRVGRDHAQVARERQLRRATEAGAVDLADRRLGHLLGEVPRVQ